MLGLNWKVSQSRNVNGDVTITNHNELKTICTVHCHDGDTRNADNIARMIVGLVNSATEQVAQRKVQRLVDQQLKDLLQEQERELFKEIHESEEEEETN